MNSIELIKAGAGSGKTHELMKRLSGGISEGMQPEGLFITTFTEKAADELTSRIRRELLKNERPDLAQRVYNGLIGTVNGVCGQLLKEYAVDLGLSPELEVLPEENADAVFLAATACVMEEWAEKLERLAEPFELNPAEEKLYQANNDWQKDVRKIVNFARSNDLAPEALKAFAEESCRQLKEIFPGDKNFSFDEIAAQVSECKDWPAKGKETKERVKDITDFLRSPTWVKAGKLTNLGYATRDDAGFKVDSLKEVAKNLPHSRELYDDLCGLIHGVFDCSIASLKAYEEYKKAFLLVDFIDQEHKLLEQLRENKNLGKQLRQRLTQIMVDEFQDTSPIQLALFLKLNEFSEKGSVWVGDPKQAIYGFRGSDPELMRAAAEAIRNSSTLSYSWRSRRTLVELANEIFTRAFSAMPGEEGALGVPEERPPEDAEGGKLEAWHGKISGREVKMPPGAIARGIAELIRDEGISPGDIAVLFRKNDDCANLAKALKEWNIQASVPSANLLNTPECRLVMAAYRYCVDRKDTVALATLLALYRKKPEWLKELQKARDAWLLLAEEERGKVDFLDSVRENDFVKKLTPPPDGTPREILEYVITALGLDEKIQSMSFPVHRMGNLESLRRRCEQYMEQALAEQGAATAAGFVAMLAETEKKPPFCSDRNSVNVLTYHGAKGLEWPVVILASLDNEEKATAFGVHVNQAEQFDVHQPLKGRSIRYWPHPFGGKSFADFNERLENSNLQIAAEEREREENKRLFYVGFTRAEDRVIFAMASKSTAEIKDRLLCGWLDCLTDSPIFNFPKEEGRRSWQVGEREFPLTTRIFSANDAITPLETPPVFREPALPAAETLHAPARQEPSGLPGKTGTAELLCEWSVKPEHPTGKEGLEIIGNAFHNFIALPPEHRKEEIAKEILANWELADRVTPAALVRAAENLDGWIKETWPQSRVDSEVPMTYRDEKGTLYQGFIDMLIETDAGYVIIDHKTGGQGKKSEAYAAEQAAQLRLYRQAVEAATNKPVTATIIHRPQTAQLFKVK